jgi:tRNA dimethylallyltransferase
MNEKIVIISGPTASGKSSLALNFAAKKDIAIINADSLQIYQGLPILSSQPTEAEQKIAPHFLYSYLKADQTSSVATWLEAVKSTVDLVLAQKKLPVIVGGSGMYISKLIAGISEIPQIDEQTKKLARELYEEIGHVEFQKKLVDLGEDEILDKHRLIRAYEVLCQTKKSITWWQNKPLKKIFPQANFIHLNLEFDRQKLYQNCNLRFEKMLKIGAIEEVQSFVNQRFLGDLQITKTLGFSEICDFLANKISQQKMIEIVAQKTRNYAKRQLTWFRHQFAQKLVFKDFEAALTFLNSNEI